MQKYAIRRLLAFIPILLIVYTLTFFVIHATPGGPWDIEAEKVMPQAFAQTMRAKYHLDDPLWKQYVDYLWNLMHGDLGPSYFSTLRVSEIIAEYWPVSIQLGAVAMGLAVLVGIPLGAIAALKQNTWLDFCATFISLFFISTPSYVLVTMLIIMFSVELGWLPSGGWDGLLDRKVLIPAFALALGPAATLARFTRASLLEVLRMDYIRTARSKGLREGAVIVRHALKNAFIPVATVAGLSLAGVITGSFFVETLYRIPGIGRYFVSSASARDYPVVLGLTLLFATLITLVNLLVDLLYGLLDPRISYK